MKKYLLIITLLALSLNADALTEREKKKEINNTIATLMACVYDFDSISEFANEKGRSFLKTSADRYKKLADKMAKDYRSYYNEKYVTERYETLHSIYQKFLYIKIKRHPKFVNQKINGCGRVYNETIKKFY